MGGGVGEAVARVLVLVPLGASRVRCGLCGRKDGCGGGGVCGAGAEEGSDERRQRHEKPRQGAAGRQRVTE
eukprot:2094452-Rhodomonas_salina.1